MKLLQNTSQKARKKHHTMQSSARKSTPKKFGKKKSANFEIDAGNAT
jgi:ribosomal protein L27